MFWTALGRHRLRGTWSVVRGAGPRPRRPRPQRARVNARTAKKECRRKRCFIRGRRPLHERKLQPGGRGSRPGDRRVRRADDTVRLRAVHLPEVLAELGGVVLEPGGRPRLEWRQRDLAWLRRAVRACARLGEVLLCAQGTTRGESPGAAQVCEAPRALEAEERSASESLPGVAGAATRRAGARW